MRVLIADDEKKVCQLIEALIEWDKLGMELLGFAHDGSTAMDMIKEHKPDIVVTDIRMPVFTGLEVIKATKRELPDTEFVVISGFKQFEYAKEALQYGVSNYLLKPIDKTELNFTLSKLKKTSTLQDTQKDLITTKDKEKIRKDILYRLITGKLTPSPSELNAEYYYNFSTDIGCVFCVGIIKIDGIQSTDKYFSTKIKYLFDTYLQNCHDYEFVDISGKYFFVLNFDFTEKYLVFKGINQMILTMSEQQDVFQNFSVSASISDDTTTFANIEKIIEQANTRITQRLTHGTTKIYSTDEKRLPPDMPYTLTSLKNRLANANTIDALKTTIDEIEQTIISAYIDGQTGLQFYKETYSHFSNVLSIKSNFETEIENIASLTGIHRYFRKTCIAAFEQVTISLNEKEKTEIAKAKDYISKNFNKPISLEIVSSEVGLSASYFSRLFKEKTSLSFTEYLFEKRMEEAKKQLRDTNQKVANICENIGYQDVKHFGKIFRKHTGLTPKDYRRLYA